MGNRTALELAGVEAQDVVGKLFWETPWWTHSQEGATHVARGYGAGDERGDGPI